MPDRVRAAVTSVTCEHEHVVRVRVLVDIVSATPVSASFSAGRPSRSSASSSRASAASPGRVHALHHLLVAVAAAGHVDVSTCRSVTLLARSVATVSTTASQPPSVIHASTLTSSSHRATVPRMRIGGTDERAEQVELAVADLFAALSEHAPPQQRGERAGVRQVRAGVDADQHREHGVRAGQGRRGQQDEQRRQVVQQRSRARPRGGGAEQREQA